jgi:diacylglycerol O-acyltransferase / wax synthase
VRFDSAAVPGGVGGALMISRVAGMDAVSLQIETSAGPSHVVAIVIIEPSDQLSNQQLHELVGSSLPKMVRFRSRIVGKPLGLGQPVWAEIADYDPTGQMHSATVPTPGGPGELAELIAGLIATPLDHRKPLWEMWSIDGLAGGRWALVVKMASAISGGLAGAGVIWPRLLTLGRYGKGIARLPEEPSLGKPPSIGALVTDTMQELFENQVTGVWLIAGAAPSVLRAAVRRLRGTKTPVEPPHTPLSMSGPVPRTVFNLPLTERRAVAFASIPIARINAVRHAFGGSTSNVFLAACTLSLRAWLQRHDTVPDYALLMQIPISTRESGSASGNDQITFARIRVPVQLDDPVQVLTDLHAATDNLKTIRRESAEKVGPKADFPTIAALIPPNVMHAGMRLYTGLGLSQRFGPVLHGTLANLPGPRAPARCAGGRVVGMHTTAPLIEGAGINITAISHEDVLDLSVCVCPDRVPAVEDIAAGIVESVDVLLAAAESSPRGVSPSVLTEITSRAKKPPRG